MIVLKIFEPDVDDSENRGPLFSDKRAQMAAFLKGLGRDEYVVERYVHGRHPEAFVRHSVVARVLCDDGLDALPLIFVDDKLACSGDYPTIDEMADLLKIGCVDSDEQSDCCSSDCCQ